MSGSFVFLSGVGTQIMTASQSPNGQSRGGPEAATLSQFLNGLGVDIANVGLAGVDAVGLVLVYLKTMAAKSALANSTTSGKPT